MKRILNKRNIIIAASVLAAAVLAAAGLLALRSRGGVKIVGRPLDRVLVNAPVFQEEHKNFHSRLLHGFRESEGIYSIFYDFPSQEFLENMEQRLDQEGLGDVYYTVRSFGIRRYLKQGRIRDLSEMKESLVKAGISESFFGLDSGSGTAMVPVSWYPWGIYYRKSVFERLDLSVPQSFEEFKAFNARLLEAGEQPFLVADRIQWPSTLWFDYLNLRINGPEFHRQWLELEASMTDERFKRVFQAYGEVVESGAVDVLDNSNSWEGMVQAFRDGKSVMLFCGDFLWDKLSDAEKEDIGWFAFPVMDSEIPRSELVSSAGYIVSAQAPNPDSTRDFLKYAVSEKGQQEIISGGGFLPVNVEVMKTLSRPDIIKGYEAVTQSESLFPFSNRGAHPKMIYPLKMSFVRLLHHSGEDEIDMMLDELEEIRLRILSSEQKEE